MASSAFSPTPSTSSLSSASHSPAPSTSAESIHSNHSSSAASAKRLSCATCRKQKAKCVWLGERVECELCLKKGLSCPGSAPRAPNRKSAPAGLLPLTSALVPSSASSSTSLVNVKWTAQHGSRAAFSPYHTAGGRPRLLGPSSSEAGLNAVSRAHILKGDLINLYSSMWPLQLNGLPTDSFVELLQGKGDEASKVFVSACIAIGARSSSHSEIVQQVGPALSLVDDDETGQFTPGGFSEWGVRRNGACITLGNKAIDDARELVQTKATFRGLKVMLAALMLSTSLDNDRRATRGLTLAAIDAFRRLLNDPDEPEEDKRLALSTLGSALLIRDCLHAISCGERLAFTPDEAASIVNAHLGESNVPGMGIPDCVNYSGLVIFDEAHMFSAFWKEHHALMYSIATLFGSSNEPFTAAKAATLRTLYTFSDKKQEEIGQRYVELQRVPEDDVFVLHQWAGSWRPAQPKTHALILVNELIGGLQHTDMIIYSRLQLELNAGRLPLEDLSVSMLVIEARERARGALKHAAQGMVNWLKSRRLHATMANMFHYMMTLPGWVDLVLARFGEPDGPLSKEAELTVAEVELLVRGLRIGGFSQSTLMLPLRELEAGLEQLRRDEMEEIAKAAAGLDLREFWVGGITELAM